jgi:hypothetical protein
MKEYIVLYLLLCAPFLVAGASFPSSHPQYTHTEKLHTDLLDVHLSRQGGPACVAGNVEGLICILLILQ